LPLMLRINPSLTLLLFLTMPLITWVAQHFGRRVEARSEEIQAIAGQISAREQAEEKAFSRINSSYVAQSMTLHQLFGVMRSLMQFMMGIGFVLIIGYGG